jgi:hypothetical protein
MKKSYLIAAGMFVVAMLFLIGAAINMAPTPPARPPGPAAQLPTAPRRPVSQSTMVNTNGNSGGNSGATSGLNGGRPQHPATQSTGLMLGPSGNLPPNGNLPAAGMPPSMPRPSVPLPPPVVPPLPDMTPQSPTRAGPSATQSISH